MRNSETMYEAISQAMRSLATGETYEYVSCEAGGDMPMPSTARLKEVLRLCREIIFPGFFAIKPLRQSCLEYYQGVCIEELAHKLGLEVFAGLCMSRCSEPGFCMAKMRDEADEKTAAFVKWLPELRRLLIGDVNATFSGDPAARSKAEVIFAYPAIRAVSGYRIAHKLHNLNVPLIPRVITEMAHSETGIDINPEAKIGERFAIDHGTGIVIGSTSVIGDDVKIYQGVTLGALSHMDADADDVRDTPRHPIIGNRVVLYAQATLLGRIKIGDDAVIGGNVWLTHDVEAGERVEQSGSK